MSSSPAPELLALALLLLPGAARAQQEEEAPPPPPPVVSTPEAGEEIVIYDTLEIARRRAEVEGLLLEQGYKEGIRKDDRTIFRPQTPWKPSVVVHDDGIVQLTRSPVRWMAPGDPDNALNNLWCLPPFTPMCVRIGGQVISKTKLDAHKNKVIESVHDPAELWRQAIVDKATWDRVNQELPARMEATWARGEPLEAGGPALPTPAARREALLTFWATRSDTREGALVARVVGDFLRYEVQPSAEPVTAAELARANALAAPIRTLTLDLPAPPAQAPTAPAPDPEAAPAPSP